MANIIGASVRAGSKGVRGEEGVYGSKVVVPKENQLRLQQFSVHKKIEAASWKRESNGGREGEEGRRGATWVMGYLACCQGSMERRRGGCAL